MNKKIHVTTFRSFELQQVALDAQNYLIKNTDTDLEIISQSSHFDGNYHCLIIIWYLKEGE